MTTKYKVLVAAVSLVVAYAVGRYTAPVKIKTETKIVEVNKKTKKEKEDISKDRHKKTTIEEVTMPDGTRKKTTTITDDTEYDKKKTSNETEKSKRTEKETKEVIKESSKLHLSGLFGANVSGGIQQQITPIYGIAVSKDVLGPISIGGFGLTNGVVGISLGLNF
jgi:hypothetical protein